MSDSDFQMSADEEDYDFEYDDDNEQLGNDSADMDAENKYYNAKAEREDNPQLAIDSFKAMIRSEPDDSEWSIKAMKQLLKLLFNLGRKQELLEEYPQLFIKIGNTKSSSMNKNYIDKSTQSIFDYLSNDDFNFMEQVLQITIDGLKTGGNERLLVRSNLRLANLYMSDHTRYAQAEEILEGLIPLLNVDDSTSVASSDKNTYTLEFLAAQIQLASLTNNLRKLRKYYEKAFTVQSVAIPHPRTLGVIREFGGQLHMREKMWSEAREDFFESFKNYDEAGSKSRIRVLRYYVLACMLSESGINPFDSQETKPYRDDPQIVGVVRLVSAFQRSDIDEFQRVMRDHDDVINDPFMKDFFGDLTNSLRSLSVLSCVRPYGKISFAKLARLVGGLTADETKTIVTNLILDGRLSDSRINQVEGVLIVNSDKVHKLDQEEAPKSKKLPARYSENEVGQKQQLEQQSLVTDSSVAMSVASGSSRGVGLERERRQVLSQWVQAVQLLHQELSVSSSNVA